MTVPVSYYTDTCPKQVPVTVENNTYMLDAGSVQWTTVIDSPTKRTVTLQIVDENGTDVTDQFELLMRLVDSTATPDETTVTGPDTQPSWVSQNKATDANGELVMVFEHVGAQRTWSLVAVFGGFLNINPIAITIGA